MFRFALKIVDLSFPFEFKVQGLETEKGGI